MQRCCGYAQMMVTALTETCDYNKARAASCKHERPEMKFIFRDAKKTAWNPSTSKESRCSNRLAEQHSAMRILDDGIFFAHLYRKFITSNLGSVISSMA